MNAWDANLNRPALSSGVGIAGDMYIVTVAGTTYLDGISVWNVGDTLCFDGIKWQPVNKPIPPTTPTPIFTGFNSINSFGIGSSGVSSPISINTGKTYLNIDPDSIVTETKPVEGSVLTVRNNKIDWLPIEDVISDLLQNPTIRDRIENAIKALKNLDMTIKLSKK